MLATILAVLALFFPGQPKQFDHITHVFDSAWRKEIRHERDVAHWKRHLRRVRRDHWLARRRSRGARLRGVRAARWALSQVGVPYVWGAESPGVGFDCSGLVQWAYSKVGIVLPRTTWGMAGVGREVPVADIRPGDIVESYGLEHVVMYVGRGLVVQAPHTGTLVGTAPLSWFPIDEVRRVD